ncbi:VTT domain-containing protein [Leuconostoc pseudomesenteroides]|uniref:VTT domain-containing protein n=1 Tax=Leuconostoc pseudomesenteroides TaxID=33968 RepID=UPI0022860881|nr:VTT domain-containing protein [Leuconostoc pseudomesenteroides]WAM37627.1 VTT domain-containing protein [Leuconostoc pseudomesenteroides]
MITILIAGLLNFNTYIPQLTQENPLLVYGLLFGLIFIETGLVIFPFLPGDSILFLVGSISTFSLQGLNLLTIIIVLSISAVLGDFVNFEIGEHFGTIIARSKLGSRFVTEKKLEKAQFFFNKHGAMAIILSRFTPLIRTLTPFVAGMSKMHYIEFARYNLVGGISWITMMTFSGFIFGSISFVKSNFELITIVIIFFSLVPTILSAIRKKHK